jgi:hypothetical protein
MPEVVRSYFQLNNAAKGKPISTANHTWRIALSGMLNAGNASAAICTATQAATM